MDVIDDDFFFICAILSPILMLLNYSYKRKLHNEKLGHLCVVLYRCRCFVGIAHCICEHIARTLRVYKVYFSSKEAAAEDLMQSRKDC